MAGQFRPPTPAAFYQQPSQNKRFSPLDFNKDGKVNFADIRSVADRNKDGKLGIDDLHALADQVLPRKKECSRCGKPLKKKSKYQSKRPYTRSLTNLHTLVLTRDRLNEVIDAASPSMEWFRGRSRARREGTLSPVPSRTSLHRSSKETRAVTGMSRQAQRGERRERHAG